MVEMAMKHGEPHTFTIVDNGMLRERREDSITNLRMSRNMRRTRQRHFQCHQWRQDGDAGSTSRHHHWLRATQNRELRHGLAAGVCQSLNCVAGIAVT